MTSYDLVFIESGRQNSNLRPSAPKTPHRSSTVLGFQSISDFLLGSAKFGMTNKAIFVRKILVEKNLNSILYKILIYLNQ